MPTKKVAKTMMSDMVAVSYLDPRLSYKMKGKIENRTEPRRWEWMFTSQVLAESLAFENQPGTHRFRCVFAGYF